MLAKKKLATRKKAPSLRRSAPKPWELAGMSRTSWYRAGKPGSGDPAVVERTARRVRPSGGDVRRKTIAAGHSTADNAVIADDTQRRINDAVRQAVIQDRNEQATVYLDRLLAGKRPYEIVQMSGTVSQFLAVLYTLRSAGFGGGPPRAAGHD